MSPSTLDQEACSKIVDYIVEASKEIERLNREMEELEQFIHYDITAYKKYRVKRGARDAMYQQIRDCHEALRVLV